MLYGDYDPRGLEIYDSTSSSWDLSNNIGDDLVDVFDGGFLDYATGSEPDADLLELERKAIRLKNKMS